MNKKYSIGIVAAALLMMLLMVMEASAETPIAGPASGTGPEGCSPHPDLPNPQQYVDYCPDNGVDGLWGTGCVGPTMPWDDDMNDIDIVITPPVEDYIMADPPDTGNDIGLCIIGTPSSCNDPRYWWPERLDRGWNWNWDWIQNRSPEAIIEPITVTLPVES